MSRSFEIFTYLVGSNGREASHVPPHDSEDIEAAGLLEDHGVSAGPTYDSCSAVSHCFPVAGKLMNHRWHTEDLCSLMVKTDSTVGNLAALAGTGVFEDYASGNYYCNESPKRGMPTTLLYAVTVYEPQQQGAQRARRSRSFADNRYCRYLLNFLLVYVVSSLRCSHCC